MSLFDTILDSYITEDNIEVINEESAGELDGLYIQVTPDPGRNYDTLTAYFKCADHRNISNSDTNVARISFAEPKYIEHGPTSFTLRTKHKKILMRLLDSPDRQFGTVWKKMIYIFNKAMETNKGNNFRLPDNLPIPDYTKL